MAGVQPEKLPDRFGQAEMDFSARLDAVQTHLRIVPLSELTPDYLNGIVDELNSALWFEGQQCFYTGQTVQAMPPIGLMSPGYTNEWKEMQTGFSNGIMTGLFDQEGNLVEEYTETRRPKIYFMFVREEFSGCEHPTAVYTRKLIDYVEANEHAQVVPTISLMPSRHLLGYVQPSQSATPFQNSSQASHYVMNLLRSTTFRRMPRAQQAHYLNDLMLISDDDFGMAGADMAVEADYYYRAVIQGDTVDYVPTSTMHSLLRCSSLGLVALEQAIIPTKAIRRDSDMIDPTAGICRVVKALEDVPDASVSKDDVLFVPLSQRRVSVTLPTLGFPDLIAASPDEPDDFTPA